MIRLLSIIGIALSVCVSFLALLSPLVWKHASNEFVMITGLLSWPVVGGIACIAGVLLTAAMLSLTFGTAIKERWLDTIMGGCASLAALCSALLGGLSCLTGGFMVFIALVYLVAYQT